jgi:hypothetical protein
MLCAVCLAVKAPNNHVFNIIKPNPKNSDKMLYAFQKTESNFRTDVINKLGYTGILQIGQQMIDETNRICKLTKNPARFTIVDALSRAKSVQMWYIVQGYYNPSYDLKIACRVWNPTASAKYYLRIQKEFLSL